MSMMFHLHPFGYTVPHICTPCDVTSLQGGITPLIWAILASQLECVEVLLDWGAQANYQDKVSAQTNTYSVDMLPSVVDP